LRGDWCEINQNKIKMEKDQDYVDSVGMANVERFKKMNGSERGIWLTPDQLRNLAKELEDEEYKHIDGSPCVAVGFMVGLGEDLKFNVEVIPLFGKIKDVNNPEWGPYDEKYKTFEYKTTQVYLEPDGPKNFKEILKDSGKKIIYRKTWIDGGFLIRNINTIKQNERLVKDEKGKPFRGKYETHVRGLYNGSIQVTHEMSHNEAQRFPPPPSQ
jgi:hypothetical protein